jgi:hypothetical protein
MSAHWVRKGARYTFAPVFWDQYDPPHGVVSGILKAGDTVRVIHPHGCPPPNTMHGALSYRNGRGYIRGSCVYRFTSTTRERVPTCLTITHCARIARSIG